MKTAEINEMIKNKRTAKYYLNEKKIMNSINHNFIVKFYNTFKSNDYLFFLLEFIDGINLREYLNNKKKENLRNLYEVSFFGAILFNVLNYLQNKRILHRDLKPENLMIGKNGYLKVIDFGIAKRAKIIANLEKKITNIRIISNNGNVLAEGNPSEQAKIQK